MAHSWDSTPRHDRFDPARGAAMMKAVVTAGNGDYEKLQLREVRRPEPGPGEIRLLVLAAGVNNTEINTRVGWYSASVTDATNAAVPSERADGGWNEATPFPFIQGTDCCGVIESVGPGGDATLIGRRVLVRPCIRSNGFGSMENVWMGSDFDGAFAQYVVVPSAEVFPVQCSWSDVELATIPCAYGTAENMVHRAAVQATDRVLVTGASGGVGSAVVQLAKRRGATVIAITTAAKMAAVRAVGADIVVGREREILATLGENAADVVIDNVGGPQFPALLRLLRRGGRYASSGAIGGPIVDLDMRTFYLKDQTLIGCTAWDEPVFPNLVAYIERGELKPLVAGVYPLEDIAETQRRFLQKDHVGKFVLLPPKGTI